MAPGRHILHPSLIFWFPSSKEKERGAQTFHMSSRKKKKKGEKNPNNNNNNKHPDPPTHTHSTIVKGKKKDFLAIWITTRLRSSFSFEYIPDVPLFFLYTSCSKHGDGRMTSTSAQQTFRWIPGDYNLIGDTRWKDQNRRTRPFRFENLKIQSHATVALWNYTHVVPQPDQPSVTGRHPPESSSSSS